MLRVTRSMLPVVVMTLLVTRGAGDAAGETSSGSDSSGGSLCDTILTGSVEKVKVALMSFKANESCSALFPQFPLDIAAWSGQDKIGSLLIASGANVNQSGVLGYTPLLRAAEALHSTFVQLLLQHRADMSARLIALPGADSSTGLDVLNVATGGYLRKFPFAPAADKSNLTKEYLNTATYLHKRCYDFTTSGPGVQVRLTSEDHPEESQYIKHLAETKAEGC